MGQKQGHEPTEWIEHDNYRYAALDLTCPSEEALGGQAPGSFLRIPQGWNLPYIDSATAKVVVGGHPWGTHWIATADGVFATAKAHSAGLDKAGASFSRSFDKAGSSFSKAKPLKLHQTQDEPAVKVRWRSAAVDESFYGFSVRVLIRSPIGERLTADSLRRLQAEYQDVDCFDKMRLLKQSQQASSSSVCMFPTHRDSKCGADVSENGDGIECLSTTGTMECASNKRENVDKEAADKHNEQNSVERRLKLSNATGGHYWCLHLLPCWSFLTHGLSIP